jgi:hypothetical protein
VLTYDFMKLKAITGQTRTWQGMESEDRNYVQQGASAGVTQSVQESGLRLYDRVSVPGRDFIFSTAHRPALSPIKSPIQPIMGTLS